MILKQEINLFLFLIVRLNVGFSMFCYDHSFKNFLLIEIVKHMQKTI
jgi:hypothetical protein